MGAPPGHCPCGHVVPPTHPRGCVDPPQVVVVTVWCLMAIGALPCLSSLLWVPLRPWVSPRSSLVPRLAVGAPQSSWWPYRGHVVPPRSSRLCGVPPAHRCGRVESPRSSLWSWCPPHTHPHCCGCLPLILKGVGAYVHGVHPSVVVVVVVLW